MVCIYAKVEHINYIKRVQSQTAGVGVMGMMGNKGGAAIRLKCYDTTICLVAAHLAAHRDNVAGRNADFANILQRIQFVHVSWHVDHLGRKRKNEVLISSLNLHFCNCPHVPFHFLGSNL